MGIRFFCPNGHKLNVKTFLAGKRGVCPKCGAKVLIPSHSTRRSHKSLATDPTVPPPSEEATVLKPPPLQGDETTVDFEPPAQSEVPPAAPRDSFDALIFEELDFNALEASSVPRNSAPSRRASPKSGGKGEVAWYVRLASGGQFGPATNELLRSWIDEGRVPPDSLVWREGWRDWQAASMAFPHLATGSGQEPWERVAPRHSSRSEAVSSSSRKGKPAGLGPLALWLLLLGVTSLLILSGALIWTFLVP